MEDSLEILARDCENCHLCDISKSRHHVVVGCGNPQSKILFIGEGPGQQEDLQGEPFVGAAGQLLDLILELTGLDRGKIYICNVIKCRPPNNRDPSKEEKANCRPFLDRQIALIAPEVIVCLGRIAACELLGDDFRITQMHGQWKEYQGIPVLATFHPAALLRDERKRPEAFSDFQALRRELRTRNLLPDSPSPENNQR